MPSAIGSLFNSLVGDIRSKTISGFLILSFLGSNNSPVKIINNFLLSEEKKSSVVSVVPEFQLKIKDKTGVRFLMIIKL